MKPSKLILTEHNCKQEKNINATKTFKWTQHFLRFSQTNLYSGLINISVLIFQC